MTDARDESSLGDDTPDLVDATVDDTPVVDTTPPIDADDFDFGEFLDGARPNHRSVKLYMRPDLIGRMEELAAQIVDDHNVGDDDPRVAEFTSTREAFLDSGRWFTVQARSGEWVEAKRKALAKRFGCEIKSDGTLSDGKRRTEALSAITTELLAEQIVFPTRGVSAERLAALAERSPTEFRKLLVAQGMANSSLAETAKVMTVDFSRAPSTATQSS